jgi:acetoacetyl-CoA synthetase
VLWTPSPERLERSNLVAFTRWLERTRGLKFKDYMELWRWSTTDLEGFWGAVWEFTNIEASQPYERVLGNRTMPGTDWFPGARLNFAQHVLRNEVPGKEALLYVTERTPLTSMTWDELAGKVRILATQLRNMGIKPGDRVAAYLPNSPHAVIAMLATTSIGAIWASVSPDFGTRGVLDRLSQLTPRLLFAVDGYQYGGKAFNRREEVAQIISGVGSLEKVIFLPYLDPSDRTLPAGNAVLWDDVLNHPPVPRESFQFEQVPFRHPLWILFSSGTTGLPKAIVHGHGGILIEQLKALNFHMEMHAGDRMFFFTTTGWMMWNFLVSSLLKSIVPVLYDGNPAFPTPDALWKIVDESKTAFCGSSPASVDNMIKAGVVPKDKFELKHLRTVMLAGSPVTAECAAWFYENVKKDLWMATGSGGTDFCTGCCGGVITQPVYAGEIQGPCLGFALAAYDEHGNSIVDQVGELVIREPTPSMPLFFWNDEGDKRYLESYFQDYPGVWRHGDFFKMNERGGCFVLGRSDSTLNRFGIRIGTAEVYRVLGNIEEVLDSMIINLDLPGGKFFMPLFVKLRPGLTLNKDIEKKINDALRREYTPRHVPDKIYQVDDIPMTLSGKKMEVPVRKILMGVPVEKAANKDTMPNPESLNYFVEYARTQTDYKLS